MLHTNFQACFPVAYNLYAYAYTTKYLNEIFNSMIKSNGELMVVN